MKRQLLSTLAGPMTTLALCACGGTASPERWAFTAAAPTVDGCALGDAGIAIFDAVQIRSDRIGGGVQWVREADGRSSDDYVCDVSGMEFACFNRALSIEYPFNSWLRGRFTGDREAFSGTVTVVNRCPQGICPPTAGRPPAPCQSIFPVSGGHIADKYPGACPSAGTKPELGAPASLAVYKGSRAEGLRLSEMDENGKFSEGFVIGTAPGDVFLNRQTRIGAWFIVHTKSGGQLQCVSAFRVDLPETRVVIQ